MYSNTCMLSKAKNKRTLYVGESGITMRKMTLEHQRYSLTPATTSNMRDHMIQEDPEELKNVLTSFQMRVIRARPSPLGRQVR